MDNKPDRWVIDFPVAKQSCVFVCVFNRNIVWSTVEARWS